MEFIDRSEETILDAMLDIHKLCRFQSREKPGTGLASNGEVRRWISQGAVELNGAKASSVDIWPAGAVTSLILFPKGISKVTLWGPTQITQKDRI